MNERLPASTVLKTAALIEALTGVALVINPVFLGRLLFGGELSGPGSALGRVTGFGLLSLGIACWPRGNAPGAEAALAAMLTYNSLATLYIGYLGVVGQWAGPFLWPAALLHAVMTVLLARAWR